jgi:hypothetical protein
MPLGTLLEIERVTSTSHNRNTTQEAGRTLAETIVLWLASRFGILPFWTAQEIHSGSGENPTSGNFFSLSEFHNLASAPTNTQPHGRESNLYWSPLPAT